MTKGSTPIVKFKTIDAINKSGMPWARRYVLIQLWHLADARTGVIPGSYSYSDLARITGMSQRALQNHIKAASADGWLEVTAPETIDAIRRHEKNRYRCLSPSVPVSVPDMSAVAPNATAPDSPPDKTPARAVAFNAPVHEMPTKSVKTLSKGKRAPKGATRDPLVCLSCKRKLWECEDYGDGGGWKCTCSAPIWSGWTGDDNTLYFYCETCGELACAPFTDGRVSA